MLAAVMAATRLGELLKCPAAEAASALSANKSSMIRLAALPSRQEIQAIIALETQPVLRNLRITQCYHDLSRAMAEAMGDANVNWCTFATWASKTAGRFVRGEALAIFRDALQSDRRLAEKLDRVNRVVRRFEASAGFDQSALFEIWRTPVAEVSGHIAAGNLAVFAELGPLFSLLYTRLAESSAYENGALERLLKELDLKTGTSGQGGQDLLRAAVGHYYRAQFTDESDQKAELILLANAETGLHEQIRLQPAIAAALQLPSDAALRALRDKVFGGAIRKNSRRRLREILEATAKPIWAEVDEELNRIWRQCATRVLMTLRLPDGEIHLGRDLRKSPGRELFPAVLQSIDLGELRTLLGAYRADGGTAAESGAADWVDITERMHFILTLFRARQQDRRLFEQPFADLQRRDIAAGRVPSGAL